MNSAIQRTESTVCCHPAAKGWEVASAFELVTFWFLSQETQPHDTQHTHFLCPFHVFFSPGSSFSFLPARVFVPFHEFQHSPFQLRKLRLQPDLHSKKKQKKNESVAPSVKHKPIFFLSFLFFFSFFWHISEQFENEKQDLLALGQTGAFLLVCARTRAAFGLTSSPVKLTSGMTHWHLIKKEKKNQIWTLGTLPMCDSMQSTHKVDQVSQRDTNCGYTTESFLAYRNQTLLLGLY